MVNRFIIQLITEYGARVTKSVFNAYQRVINTSKSPLSHLFRPEQRLQQGGLLDAGTFRDEAYDP